MLRSEEHTLNSSHGYISYAVFCLKKKNKIGKVNGGSKIALRGVKQLVRRYIVDIVKDAVK